jgi:hypothetical protein
MLVDKKRSKSPNTNVMSGAQNIDEFSVALMQELNCENHH